MSSELARSHNLCWGQSSFWSAEIILLKDVDTGPKCETLFSNDKLQERGSYEEDDVIGGATGDAGGRGGTGHSAGHPVKRAVGQEWGLQPDVQRHWWGR